MAVVLLNNCDIRKHPDNLKYAALGAVMSLWEHVTQSLLPGSWNLPEDSYFIFKIKRIFAFHGTVLKCMCNPHVSELHGGQSWYTAFPENPTLTANAPMTNIDISVIFRGSRRKELYFITDSKASLKAILNLSALFTKFFSLPSYLFYSFSSHAGFRALYNSL